MQAAWVVWLLAAAPVGLDAQVINEVLADNESQPPADIEGGHPDLIEIFNNTDDTVTLGVAELRNSYFLACVPASQDPPVFDPATAWPFPPNRSTIARNARLTIFCDGNSVQGTCELHASFNIAADGSESVVLWGPEVGGMRAVVDRVFLPETGPDVSWGRFPDGSGGNNVPVEDHFEHFVFYPPGSSSFGSCAPITGICLVQCEGCGRRHCSGAPNPAPPAEANLAPRIVRVAQSNNAPAAGEAVRFTARVRDDEFPLPGNIASVEIVFRVKPEGSAEFGAEETVLMQFDDSVGQGGLLVHPERPLDVFSHWHGSIPGQPAGSRVEFFFRVADAGGLSGTRPADLCHLLEVYGEGVGPCDREFGPEGNGCVIDAGDAVLCPGPRENDPEVPFTDERFVACNIRSTYRVAFTPRPELAGLLINEVVPIQNDVLTDLTEAPCTTSSDVVCPAAAERCCPRDAHPDCCRRDEDFLELLNTSDSPANVSGCWLSDSPFDPQRWRFPDGAVIPANTRVIVWLDRDGSRCPNNARPDKPCWWECPDPNLQSMGFDPPEFHASFAIDADGDHVFLFDTEENGFGLVHGVDFSDPTSICGFEPWNDVKTNELRYDFQPNRSLSLVPDGARDGRWVITDTPTPREVNQGGCPDVLFRRGDATGDGGVDISDGISILNFLFLGGPAPGCFDAADSDDSAGIDLSDGITIFNYLFLGGAAPRDPGPIACGVDPTEDSLADCVYEPCT